MHDMLKLATENSQLAHRLSRAEARIKMLERDRETLVGIADRQQRQIDRLLQDRVEGIHCLAPLAPKTTRRRAVQSGPVVLRDGERFAHARDHLAARIIVQALNAHDDK